MGPARSEVDGDPVITGLAFWRALEDDNNGVSGEVFNRIEVAVRAAYAAGIAEGRAQAQRERETERLDTIATEFDR